MKQKPRFLIYTHQAFSWLERISSHKGLTCLLVMALTMGSRIALLPRLPIPQPHVADEFSYLLGAETFASGRMTNATHPMWEHFETFHELMRPTYMSKFPPAQALFLAAGWKLLGHPWFGVWISFGIFSAALCWMLQNWVPPIYALLGTVITLAQISVLSYWMNSYWGGAVAAIAGCLLLGVLPRLARHVKSWDVAVGAAGLILLANSRPLEGFIMSTAAILALLFWRARRRQRLSEFFSFRCVLPFLLIFGTGILLDGYYNYRVTGHALELPYFAYSQQYTTDSFLIVLPEHAPVTYRHPSIENSWKQETAQFRAIKSSLALNLSSLYSVSRFFISALYLFPVALGLLLSRGYRFWTAAAICFFVWFGFLLETFKAPHYIAGSAGLLPILAMYGFRWLRVAGRSYGPVFVLSLTVLLGMRVFVGGVQERRDQGPRMIAAGEVEKMGGRHLILVRHSSNYVERSDECVYNAADIDGSPIVWAHDMGEAKNRELIDYYGGLRKVWLYQPDTDPKALIPYEPVKE